MGHRIFKVAEIRQGFGDEVVEMLQCLGPAQGPGEAPGIRLPPKLAIPACSILCQSAE